MDKAIEIFNHAYTGKFFQYKRSPEVYEFVKASIQGMPGYEEGEVFLRETKTKSINRWSVSQFLAMHEAEVPKQSRLELTASLTPSSSQPQSRDPVYVYEP